MNDLYVDVNIFEPNQIQRGYNFSVMGSIKVNKREGRD